MESKTDKYQDIRNDLIEWAKDALDFYKNTVDELEKYPNLTSDDYKDLIYRFKSWQHLYGDQIDYEMAQKYSKLSAACEIMLTLSIGLPLDQVNQLSFDSAFHLGLMKGLRDTIEAGWWEGMERIHYKKKSSDYRKGGWEPVNQKREALFEEVRAIAERYYRMGGTKRHYEVAQWFRNKPKYKEIGRRKMLGAVGKVADKYGFKSGLKKTESP